MSADQARTPEQTLAAALAGDIGALLDLGTATSTGDAPDLVQAHKWYNLAAQAGSRSAELCRAEIAGEMSPLQIARAQREARLWLDRARQASA